MAESVMAEGRKFGRWFWIKNETHEMKLPGFFENAYKTKCYCWIENGCMFASVEKEKASTLQTVFARHVIETNASQSSSGKNGFLTFQLDKWKASCYDKVKFELRSISEGRAVRFKAQSPEDCQKWVTMLMKVGIFKSPEVFGSIKYETRPMEEEDAFQLVETDGMHFKTLEVRFKFDRKIMLAAVRQNGLALQFGKFSVPEGNIVDYTVDREVVLQAIRQNCSAFSFADVSLQVDRSVVLAMFDTDIADVMMLLRNGISPLMLDEEVMLKAGERDAHAVERARKNLYICPNVKEESLSPKELKDLQAQALLTRLTENGDLVSLKRLLAMQVDINTCPYIGYSAMHAAAESGRVGLVHFLHEQKASVESQMTGGTTPLMLAAMGGKSECIKLLSELGADVNARNEGGTTALMLAAMEGHTQTIASLAQLGADIDAVENELILEEEHVSEKLKILETSAQEPVLASKLPRDGADTDKSMALVSSSQQQQQLTLSSAFASTFTGRMISDIKNSLALTSLGSLRAVVGSDFAAHLDRILGFVALPREMAEFRNHTGGMNAIMKAAASGHTQAVQALVELGANVNAVSKGGMSALMIAAMGGHKQTVKYLCHVIDDVDSLDKEGHNAVQWAERTGNWETARMIKEAAREKKLLQQATYEELEPSSEFHMDNNGQDETEDSSPAAGSRARTRADAGDIVGAADSEDGHHGTIEEFLEPLADLQVEEEVNEDADAESEEPTIQV
ncbi:hypothetical protein GUITHDRAFT_110059 [Guillardia theta CCMP2712]|uniref:DUF4116 domain-containing protein n=1 Tax=Guillardia theta (strain CCMP2712) TaxID=905079 RepID=L1J5Z1_GUITC|nr:hypothetical protein GUITHDRAFT_110059 [Guillardia theta CCMP2712]EKX43953.1 hypothetical protein GUITHDRAFT_110059 [Guillardia theta CCMP2712]|eukprot:XP_005830933.1 hypothetical protein GUITHDRAFT_110059 [Guillardia theta CCMP2712]